MKLRTVPPYLRLAHAACLTLVLGLAWSSPVQAHIYGGRAFGAFVNVPTLGAGSLYLSDSGQLSPGGGWEGAGLLGAQVPSVLAASALNAATSGGGDWASSASSLADVALLPGHVAEATASFVRAEADATTAGVRGSTEISNLTFGGVPVAVTGQPNQRFEIPGLLGPVATLIINEQTATADAITVNALRLILATGEQIVVASARSSLNPYGDVILASASAGDCTTNASQVRNLVWNPTATPPIVLADGAGKKCPDFVTGGGWFEPPNSNLPGRVNFGFNAGPRSFNNLDLKGHLNFIDHSGGLVRHVQGINVTSYVPWGADPANCRVFEGDAVVNGMPGSRYRATVCDYDEPGRFDRFFLELLSGPFAGYFADNKRTTSPCPAGKPECGELDGGNIQLHIKKCPRNASFTPGRKAVPIVL